MADITPEDILPRGKSLILKKPRGKIHLELKWHPDKDTMDNIIEEWECNSMGPIKESVWILSQEFLHHYDFKLRQGYEPEIIDYKLF